MLRRRATTALLAVCAVAPSLAFGGGCGNDAASNPSTGDPLEASTFNAPPPPCYQGTELCPEEFIYPYGGETSVELMGNFQANGWVNGAYFSQDHSIWQVYVNVPSGQPTSYKLLINGTTWVNDPANANVDAQGNSLKAALTCPLTYVCDEPDAGPADAAEADGG
jgi:hypothetical protein